MAGTVPLQERSVAELSRGLAEGEFNVKEAFLAQRLLQQRRGAESRRRMRWFLAAAVLGAALATSMATAVIIGLFR